MQPLSPQELTLVKWVGKGLTLREAAEKMKVSERTAKVHAEHVRLKVGVSRTRDAAFVLRELGIID